MLLRSSTLLHRPTYCYMHKRYLGVACLGLLSLAALASWVRTTGLAEDSPSPAPVNSAAANLPTAAHDTGSPMTNIHGNAGRKVFVDPATGKLIPPPRPAAPVTPPLEDALSTSGEGLRETPGKTRGGGIKIDLQGRFRSTVTATIDPEGRLSTRCETEPEIQSSEASR